MDLAAIAVRNVHLLCVRPDRSSSLMEQKGRDTAQHLEFA